MRSTDAGIRDVESDMFAVGGLEQDAERPLSDKEIERYREHLQQLREWLLQSIAHLEAQSLRPAGSRTAGPEGDDLAWQSNIKQRAVADKRLLLNEITQALARVNDNTYGRCAAGDALIPRSLLEDIPWARFCPKCAVRHG